MKRDTIGKQNKADEQPPGSTTPHPHSARPYYIRASHAPLYSRGGSGAELGGDPCARPSGGSSLVGLVLARPGALPLSVWCSPVRGHIHLPCPCRFGARPSWVSFLCYNTSHLFAGRKPSMNRKTSKEDLPKRESVRLPHHNYRWTASYFVTIRAAHHQPVFEMSELRTMLQDAWTALPERFPCVSLDEFI